MNKSQEEYFSKLYLDKRRLKAKLKHCELRLVETLAFKLCNSNFKPTFETHNILSELEWYLTWRLKVGQFFKVKLWCDGLENVRFKKTEKNTAIFKGDIWIGLDDHSGDRSVGKVQGILQIKDTAKGLKDYSFDIEHELFNGIITKN